MPSNSRPKPCEIIQYQNDSMPNKSQSSAKTIQCQANATTSHKTSSKDKLKDKCSQCYQVPKQVPKMKPEMKPNYLVRCRTRVHCVDLPARVNICKPSVPPTQTNPHTAPNPYTHPHAYLPSLPHTPNTRPPPWSLLPLTCAREQIPMRTYLLFDIADT